MTGRQGLLIGWPTLVTGGVLLVLLGGAGTYWLMHRAQSAQPSGAAQASMTKLSGASAPPSAGAPLADVVIPLSREAIERAGITVTTISAERVETRRRLPAVVQANAYKRVTVTPLVSGRVTRVTADLGQTVTPGSLLAELFSPELADAETRYLSMRAELDAHERELARTGQLVEIGAASRQELERLHAEHSAKLAEVDSARSKLSLLGLNPEAIDRLVPGSAIAAEAAVRAPTSGVVIERMANVGLNVDASTTLFTIADLSTLWVLADVYEQDFAQVHQGEAATVTFAAFPDRLVQGTISYIDPQVDPQMRTAKMRVEVANPRGDLRIGMIADVQVTTNGSSPTPLVPRTAFQHLGDRTVVYLARTAQPGEFIEREVQVGDTAADQDVAVLRGVAPGDSVVTQGSFAVRAEGERLGLRSGAAGTGPKPSGDSPGTVASQRVLVTEHGYEPASLTLPAGSHAQITFLRTTDQTCGTEITFPSLNIRRPLPLNQPVTIELTVPASGSLGFQCGMNMLKGSVVAQ
jgi:cobalt-zinc-cadmium efflux system membrane fusion protein